MTERKFKVGDRVRVAMALNGLAEGHVGLEGEVLSINQLWLYPYRVRFKTKPVLDFDERELEPVSAAPKAGDRVRITLERDVYQTTDESATPYVMVGYHPLYLSASSEDKVEVIERAKPPIVLPTGKSAIIQVKDYKYVRMTKDDWLSLGSQMRFVDRIVRETAEDNRDTYRVIFEGEDE